MPIDSVSIASSTANSAYDDARFLARIMYIALRENPTNRNKQLMKLLDKRFWQIGLSKEFKTKQSEAN